MELRLLRRQWSWRSWRSIPKPPKMLPPSELTLLVLLGLSLADWGRRGLLERR